MNNLQNEGAFASMVETVNGARGKAIDDYLQSMEHNAHFMGSVLVEQEGQIILCKGYGKANETSKNTPSTPFYIASITKQFTATAMMKLCEEKKIDLEAPINQYLPKKYQCTRWKNIKVEHLLSHESGILDYADVDDYWNICAELTVDSVIEQAKGQQLLFSPGDNYCYSNTGYDLLGKIIEEVSHLSYGEFIKQKLLIPLAMTSSGIRDGKNQLPSHLALGYYVLDRELKDDPRDEFCVLYADGAMYSTVLDLAKWSKVLDGSNSAVLSPESVKLMISRQYGLVVDHAFGYTRIHHNGAMAGFSTDFCKFPEENLLMIVLSNNADFIAEYITSNFAKFLLHNKPLNAIESFPRDFDYSPYLETFISEENEEDEEEYTFERKKGTLILEGNDGDIETFLLSNGRVFIPCFGTEYKLLKDGALIVYNGDGEKIDTLVEINSR